MSNIHTHDLDVATQIGGLNARMDRVEEWQKNLGEKIEALVKSNQDLSTQVARLNDNRFSLVRLLKDLGHYKVIVGALVGCSGAIISYITGLVGGG